MAEHSSLTAQFTPPPPLRPARKMQPNERCWCGSGKKWKKCHKDRETQSKLPLGAHIAAMKTDMIGSGYCSHPEASADTCGDRIIKAHTVQKRGGIAAIAENGHVISVKSGFEDISKNDGEIVPRQLGVRDASTFNGFCNKHDDEMFKPVEVGRPILTTETTFLLAFRALAYEVYSKQSAIRCLSVQRDIDKGSPFEAQCFVQQHLHIYGSGLQRGLKDVTGWKAEYDSAFKNKNFDCFNFYAIAFADILPVVGCGAFHPEFDFYGNTLQRISRGSGPFNHISFNLTVLNGVSVLVLGWMQDTDGPAAQFANSYRSLPADEKADAAVRLAFEHIENIYFRPSWWNNITEAMRAEAIRRMRTGTGLVEFERVKSCLSSTSVQFGSSAILEEKCNY